MAICIRHGVLVGVCAAAYKPIIIDQALTVVAPGVNKPEPLRVRRHHIYVLYPLELWAVIRAKTNRRRQRQKRQYRRRRPALSPIRRPELPPNRRHSQGHQTRRPANHGGLMATAPMRRMPAKR